MNLLAMIGTWPLFLIAFAFILPLLALIDILRNNFSGSNKLIWVLVVLLLPILGSILYFFIGVNQKTGR